MGQRRLDNCHPLRLSVGQQIPRNPACQSPTVKRSIDGCKKEMEFCALGLSSNSIFPLKTDKYTLTTLSSYPSLFSSPRSTQTRNELREIYPESSRIRKQLLIESDHSRGYRVEVDGVAPTQFHVCRPRISNEQVRVDLPLIDFC